MTGSNGLQRYNGVEQDDEGAYVYYDEHIAALRRAKAEGVREIVRGLKNKRIDFEQKLSVTRSSFMQDEYEANIELLSELITEADARAAQIEEGSDVFCSTKKTNCSSRTADFARDKSS